MKRETIDVFFTRQLAQWPEVAERYARQRDRNERFLDESGETIKVVFDPVRTQSVTAATKPSADRRACPLCLSNLPLEQQKMDFSERYFMLVNPFPVFRKHFTIPAVEHVPQQTDERFRDIFDLAKEFEGYTLFFNGPESGASIPQHAHFQATERYSLPLEKYWSTVWQEAVFITGRKGVSFRLGSWLDYPLFMLTATSRNDAVTISGRLFGLLTEGEKRMNNLIAWYEDARWYVAVVIRKAHRPSCYYASGAEQLLISPGAVEMGGNVVTIREEDFMKLTRNKVKEIMQQVVISFERATEIASGLKRALYPDRVSVGIIESPIIRFCLHTPYILYGESVEGEQEAAIKDGMVLYNGTLYENLLFAPCDEEAARIEVFDVTIGKKFHWEQQQTQNFQGFWKIVVEDNHLVGINILPVEEYLKSVISSEMSAEAPLQSLKAHAVISRSWLINQIQSDKSPSTIDEEGLVWYDSSGHTLYDVCADDHCQRYQGINQITNQAALEAVESTWGEVLTDKAGNVADARYSKCCGGVMEEFQYIWEDEPKSYMQAKRDCHLDMVLPRLDEEESMKAWVTGSPESWCNVTDPAVIATVMKSYDQQTPDFYRWTVEYTPEELAGIIHRKTGIDLGTLTAIVPLKRGKSGRIYKLRIEGALGSRIIGKELEIRRVLSPAHLYSSAFVVENRYDAASKLIAFVLRGAGWGHGAGLCQIGAANMAVNGYSYQEILFHYYPETQIEKIYE